jgi:hypothetical protein
MGRRGKFHFSTYFICKLKVQKRVYFFIKFFLIIIVMSENEILAIT